MIISITVVFTVFGIYIQGLMFRSGFSEIASDMTERQGSIIEAILRLEVDERLLFSREISHLLFDEDFGAKILGSVKGPSADEIYIKSGSYQSYGTGLADSRLLSEAFRLSDQTSSFEIVNGRVYLVTYYPFVTLGDEGIIIIFTEIENVIRESEFYRDDLLYKIVPGISDAVSSDGSPYMVKTNLEYNTIVIPLLSLGNGVIGEFHYLSRRTVAVFGFRVGMMTIFGGLLFCLVSGILLFIVIERNLTRPFISISGCINALADTRQDTNIDRMLLSRKDEFGTVSRVIMKIQRKLVEQRRELINYSNNLEKIVEERTSDLSEKNTELAGYKQFLEEISSPVAITDSDFNIEWANRAFLQRFSELNGCLGSGIKTLVPYLIKPEVMKQIGPSLSERGVWRGDLCFPALEEELFYSVTLQKQKHPDLERYFCIMIDVTVRKIQEFELISQNRELEADLGQKTLLLNEVHHRIKNNFQTIKGLLSIQQLEVDDDDAGRALSDSISRIGSMALIHEQIYRTGNFSSIPFSDYIKNLSKELFDSIAGSTSGISMLVSVDDIELSIDKAVPVVLMMNEIITNSLKHAFPDRSEGLIYVRFSRLDDGRLSLVIGDNGKGIPEDFEVDKATSLGMKIISSIAVQQLNASLSVNTNDGTEFVIIFED